MIFVFIDIFTKYVILEKKLAEQVNNVLDPFFAKQTQLN